MENLIIATDRDTPYIPNVSFNTISGVCVIEGESFMDNSYEFYSPLIAWIKMFADEIKEPLSLQIKLTYFNTSTSRLLLEMLDTIKEYVDAGGIADVIWFCDETDVDMRDEIEDFIDESGIEINVKQFVH